ncbi:hypothetical protein Esti_004415 [Eimeria stiedai]
MENGSPSQPASPKRRGEYGLSIGFVSSPEREPVDSSTSDSSETNVGADAFKTARQCAKRRAVWSVLAAVASALLLAVILGELLLPAGKPSPIKPTKLAKVEPSEPPTVPEQKPTGPETVPKGEPTEKPEGPKEEPTEKPEGPKEEPTEKPEGPKEEPTEKPEGPKEEPTEKPEGPKEEPTEKPEGPKEEPTEKSEGPKEEPTGPPKVPTEKSTQTPEKLKEPGKPVKMPEEEPTRPPSVPKEEPKRTPEKPKAEPLPPQFEEMLFKLAEWAVSMTDPASEILYRWGLDWKKFEEFSWHNDNLYCVTAVFTDLNPEHDPEQMAALLLDGVAKLLEQCRRLEESLITEGITYALHKKFGSPESAQVLVTVTGMKTLLMIQLLTVAFTVQDLA